MSYIKLFSIVIFFSVIALASAKAQYRVFYIPYEIETLVRVGADKIEKEASFVFEYEDKRMDLLFLKNKKSAANPSTLANLRGKITRLKDNRSIYVDKASRVLGHDMKRLVLHLEAKVSEACKNPQSKFVMKLNHCLK